MDNQYQPYGSPPPGQYRPPAAGGHFQPAGGPARIPPAGGGSGLGWWIASGVMALLLVAGIILLVSMLGGGGDRGGSVADPEGDGATGQTGERREPGGGPSDGPASSPAELPPGVESDDVHVGFYEEPLPLLPIPAADYVFLDGYTLEKDDNCWTASYDIAYKGEWNVQRLRTIFESDEMLATVERRLPELYPNGVMEGFDLFIAVYQYDGGEKASDYEDVDYEDYELYFDSSGSCE